MKGINQDNLNECHAGLLADVQFLEYSELLRSGIPHRIHYQERI